MVILLLLRDNSVRNSVNRKLSKEKSESTLFSKRES